MGIHVNEVFLIIQSFLFVFIETTKFANKVTVYLFRTLKTELLRIVYKILVFISS